MRSYEAMLVLRPDLDEEATAALLARVQELITKNGGQVESVDSWGRRRLAYEIDGQREGIYVLVNFQAEPGVSAELERVLRLTEEVMRHLVVRDEE